MKKTLLIAIIMMAIALSGCKHEGDPPEKKIVITGITSYNNLEFKLSLYKVEFNDALTPEASASAMVNGGTATFVLYNKDSQGAKFTGSGFYYPVITVFDANGTDYGAGIGTTALPIFIIRETTNLRFNEFEFKGTKS